MKKLIVKGVIFIFSYVFFLHVLVVSGDCYAAEKPLVGDVTGNKQVTLEDANVVLKAALKMINLSGEALQAADVDYDSAITLADANQVLKIALKISVEDEFVIKDGVLVEYRGTGRKVVVPDGVTVIGTKVFADNKSVEEIVLPDSVTKIEERAFTECSLKSITLPDTITYIGDAAFFNCNLLKEIKMPDTVRYIGKDVFAGCSLLTNVQLSMSLSAIPDRAFYGCYSLKSINLPDTISSWGERAFWGCRGLADDNGYVIIKSILYDGNLACNNQSPELEDLVLPDTVTIIAEGAFAENWGFRSIVLPEGVKIIEDNAFLLCSSLTDITIPVSVTTIGPKAFAYIGNGTGPVIHGYEGSYAQNFARENGMKFQVIV